MHTNQTFNLAQTPWFQVYLPDLSVGCVGWRNQSIIWVLNQRQVTATISATAGSPGTAASSCTCTSISVFFSSAATKQLGESPIPALLLLLRLRRHRKILVAGVKCDQVLVLSVRSLVDVQAAIQTDNPFGRGRLAPPLLLALVVLQPGGGAPLPGLLQHEKALVAVLLLAQVTAFFDAVAVVVVVVEVVGAGGGKRLPLSGRAGHPLLTWMPYFPS